MTKVKLENFRGHLNEKLKNKQFRKDFEFERAKVALVQKLAELRESSGLRQVDLAKKMDVSQQFISQIETSQENNLTLETLLNIARSLGRRVEISFPKASRRDSYLKLA